MIIASFITYRNRTLAIGARDHQAQAVGRRDQAEGERDDADDREVHRVHVHRLGQRLEDRADDDDRRDRVEEAADDEEAEGDEEAGAGDAPCPSWPTLASSAFGIW